MSDLHNDDMIEAARLTQAGRLRDATALLQKLLRVGAHARTSNADAPAKSPVIDLTPIDLNAPSSEASRNGTEPLGVFERLGLGRPTEILDRLRKPSPPPAEIVPSVGRFVAKSFSNEAGSRAYKLYIPSRHDDRPRPLIVMLHGCTQSPDDFAAGTRMNFAADEHGCFVVYPEQSRAANASKCWNWFNSGDQIRGQGEPSLIAGITRQVMADHKIDARRVYVAGLSAGGAAAAVLAEAYPELYAAVGVHSGLACGVARDMPSAFTAMQGQHPPPNPMSGRQPGKIVQTPTIVFHGDRDTTVHPRNGVEVIARARADGKFQTIVENGSAATGRAYTRSVQRDARGRGILEEWVIHGAGHAWSGGSPAGSFTDAKGPEATKEMLRFFLEHTRKAD